MKHAAKPSNGLTLARNRLVTMSDGALASLTADRLIASYGVTQSEADHLIRSLRRA